jgi:adenine-specific DNA-methyltransferase
MRARLGGAVLPWVGWQHRVNFDMGLNPKMDDTLRPALGQLTKSDSFDHGADVVVFSGPCELLLSQIPDSTIQLTVTSPPYNIGKSYERRVSLDCYLTAQARVISEVARVTADGGSVCWQVGNYVVGGEVVPLDVVLYPIFKATGLKLRNRIIWHYEHGLHASRRFSGRYETILWFTKGDAYFFDIDPLRTPQKYPNKRYYRGPKIGQLSGNPRGKNPGDVWIFPNVKWNHVEKTIHPCQFPVELAERLVLAMTRPGDWVLDPYGGVGSSVLAAVLNGRRGAMAEVVKDYVYIAEQRIRDAEQGKLRTRPITRPVYQPR